MSRASRIAKIATGTTVAVVILACVAASYVITGARNADLSCSSLRITITDSLENRFVTGKDIAGYVVRELGNYEGSLLKDIDLGEIEKVVNSKTAVKRSEAFVTKDGALNIEVSQRRPILRFQKNGCGVYADEEGFLFPLKSSSSCHVMVIDGELPLNVDAGYKGRGSEKEQKWIDSMVSMVSYMNEDKVWSEDIVQIHVEKNGDLILIPREGNEKFLFGKPDALEQKFKMMEYYYSNVVPAKGKDFYSSVNVKYDGQVICRQ